MNALLTFSNIVTLEVSVLEQGFPQIKTVENVPGESLWPGKDLETV